MLIVQGIFWFGMLAGYGLFGVVLGMVVSSLIFKHPSTIVLAGLLVLVTAWCTSISMGFNSPNLASGPLACFVLIVAIALVRPAISERYIVYGITVTLMTALSIFMVARQNWIYREAPAARLTEPLDGVFPGARNIRTNANTLAYLQDLKLAISKMHGQPFIINVLVLGNGMVLRISPPSDFGTFHKPAYGLALRGPAVKYDV